MHACSSSPFAQPPASGHKLPRDAAPATRKTLRNSTGPSRSLSVLQSCLLTWCGARRQLGKELEELEASMQRKTAACDKLEEQIKRRIQQQQEHARAKRQQQLLLHTMVGVYNSSCRSLKHLPYPWPGTPNCRAAPAAAHAVRRPAHGWHPRLSLGISTRRLVAITNGWYPSCDCTPGHFGCCDGGT